MANLPAGVYLLRVQTPEGTTKTWRLLRYTAPATYLGHGLKLLAATPCSARMQPIDLQPIETPQDPQDPPNRVPPFSAGFWTNEKPGKKYRFN